MRNGQNNNKRMRNRNNNNNNNNNNNRRGQNPMTRVFESNGPDIKIRGTASHVAEKYVQLARDARSSGDPVAAENYYQHAEHYFRLIAAAQEQFRQSQPQPRIDNETPSEDGDDESENFSNFGQEPGFVPAQPQPYMPRENHQREGQPYQPRDQHQPREHNQNRDHRPQPQYQRNPNPSRMSVSTGCRRSSPDRSRRSMAVRSTMVVSRVMAANAFRPAAAVGRTVHGPKAWRRRRRVTISIRGTSKRPKRRKQHLPGASLSTNADEIRHCALSSSRSLPHIAGPL